MSDQCDLLRSSKTLFTAAASDRPVFSAVPDRSFAGDREAVTIPLLAERAVEVS